MFKITFIDSVKKSKQYWHIEEHKTTYIFGRNCLKYFSSLGVKKNECYVDIYSDVDTAISKDQIYVTLSTDNILEIKFKNKLRTFSADRECSKVDEMKYEYYYIQARKTEKLKFKADKNRYIIRVEYDGNIKTGNKHCDINSVNSESFVARKNFSIDQLASASIDSNENQENDEILKNNVISEEVPNECILDSSKTSDRAEKIVSEPPSDDDINVIKADKKTNRKNSSVSKPRGKPGRKPNLTTTAALAKKEKQKATVSNLMNTLYEAQKKNKKSNEDAANGTEENISMEGFASQIRTKSFCLKEIDTNTNSSSLESGVRKSTVNYKRFKKRKLGDLDSKSDSFLCPSQPKLIMKKYEDPTIPKFQTMKDLEVDTRYMSVETKEKLKQAKTYMGARKKTSETKHLFLDD